MIFFKRLEKTNYEIIWCAFKMIEAVTIKDWGELSIDTVDRCKFECHQRKDAMHREIKK